VAALGISLRLVAVAAYRHVYADADLGEACRATGALMGEIDDGRVESVAADVLVDLDGLGGVVDALLFNHLVHTVGCRLAGFQVVAYPVSNDEWAEARRRLRDRGERSSSVASLEAEVARMRKELPRA
jgi:hypothetical protein